MFDNAHQIQVASGDQLIVVALGDHPEPSSGHKPLIDAAFTSLRQAGVRQGIAVMQIIPDWYANIQVPVPAAR
jgi:hypothetical protein